MFIEIQKNPNCKSGGLFVFEELSEVRPIKGVRAEEGGSEIEYEVVGVDAGGKFVQAYAQKVSDSGSGIGYLIYGGAWGIRLKPKLSVEAWDLASKSQRGESYMIYGSEEDIIFNGQ